ncbi:MAG: RNA polymerase sigma factor [Verrucomicrobiia bacterium]|jgi:RNA polymerase sigma-70 factor (ECF subfamily)
MEERDEELGWVRRSQSGDPEAFEELVRRYQRMIHALTFRMTGSSADAEDLAQEIFIQAFRRLGSFRGDAKFSSWLYRIGVNTCLNWRKSTQRREKLHQDWADSDHSTSSGTDELTVRVQEALMQLPAKQRAAVVLTVYDGLNHAEAARILGCSETTVSWRIFVARKKLKRWLQQDIHS